TNGLTPFQYGLTPGPVKLGSGVTACGATWARACPLNARLAAPEPSHASSDLRERRAASMLGLIIALHPTFPSHGLPGARRAAQRFSGHLLRPTSPSVALQRGAHEARIVASNISARTRQDRPSQSRAVEL